MSMDAIHTSQATSLLGWAKAAYTSVTTRVGVHADFFLLKRKFERYGRPEDWSQETMDMFVVAMEKIFLGLATTMRTLGIASPADGFVDDPCPFSNGTASERSTTPSNAGTHSPALKRSVDSMESLKGGRSGSTTSGASMSSSFMSSGSETDSFTSPAGRPDTPELGTPFYTPLGSPAGTFAEPVSINAAVEKVKAAEINGKQDGVVVSDDAHLGYQWIIREKIVGWSEEFIKDVQIIMGLILCLVLLHRLINRRQIKAMF